MPQKLTKRQQQVVDLVAAGFTDAEIAVRLGIRRESVRGHIEAILHRLTLRDRQELETWTTAGREEPP
jgi:DNA-binding NarL/FixJ family response regulator